MQLNNKLHVLLWHTIMTHDAASWMTVVLHWRTGRSCWRHRTDQVLCSQQIDSRSARQSDHQRSLSGHQHHRHSPFWHCSSQSHRHNYKEHIQHAPSHTVISHILNNWFSNTTIISSTLPCSTFSPRWFGQLACKKFWSNNHKRDKLQSNGHRKNSLYYLNCQFTSNIPLPEIKKNLWIATVLDTMHQSITAIKVIVKRDKRLCFRGFG